MKAATLLFRSGCVLAAVGAGLLLNLTAAVGFLALVKLDELVEAVNGAWEGDE